MGAPAGPKVAIAIAGLPHSGKSVLAALIGEVLDRHGIAHSGPEALPERSRAVVRKAIGNLRERGLRVRFAEVQTGERAGAPAAGERPS